MNKSQEIKKKTLEGIGKLLVESGMISGLKNVSYDLLKDKENGSADYEFLVLEFKDEIGVRVRNCTGTSLEYIMEEELPKLLKEKYYIVEEVFYSIIKAEEEK